jgi:type II secretory pathway pseudopilin PulG
MGRQAGYTIVEVTLFLALTGLLVVAVLTGFGGAINNNRKTDTTRSFESAIETLYAGVRSGEANRPIDATGKAVCINEEAYPGASNECLVIGKLVRFVNSRTVDVYNVVSNVDPDSGCTVTGAQILNCYHPRVLEMSQIAERITPEWQAQVGQVTFRNSVNGVYATNINFIGFLRHPASELVYIVPFSDTTVPASGEYEITGITNGYANSKGQICLEHDDYPVPRSYVRFNGGEGVGSIDMSDNPVTGAPACN